MKLFLKCLSSRPSEQSDGVERSRGFLRAYLLRKYLVEMTGFYCAIIFLVLPVSLMASPLSSLSNKLMSMKTLSASFVQKVEADNRVLSTSEGNMALKRPGQFYWNITSPQKQLLIVSKGKVIYYQPGLQQVTIRHFSNNVGQTPAAFLLNGSEALLKKYYNVSEQNGYYTLKPKDQNNLVQSVDLYFDDSDISKIVLHDHLGHVTEIELGDVDVNDGVDDSLFNFNIPTGVDVVRE